MIRDVEDKGYDPAGIRWVPPAPTAATSEADARPIRVRPAEPPKRKPDPADEPRESKPG